MSKNDKKLNDQLNLVFRYLNITPLPTEDIIKDIRLVYPLVSTDIIIQAMQKGALGYYGRTRKFSSMEVNSWVGSLIINSID